ncbi:terpene synthase family, metal binding domain-containing protein [Hirsutella rhossiliensis]|uniref:Terpene synthase n=1 Tax=Hirsutella rhossiliensis TaxID=111463 RepID=A0A9P8N7L9_9HYPO|nr:terpene synthase family, metal binding domain-containing protein [Hirsutella rhossiliensis]KAH0968460.1 terpene synthase family, metal binding domain-containing protein [Hirsutella rhossiliensis]
MPRNHQAPDLAAALARSLVGKNYSIPDLNALLGGWPAGINEHLERLRPVVDQMLESIIANKKILPGLKRCDFALLTSLAAWTELEVAAAFMVWIFVWDDGIDEGDSEVATHEQCARIYCNQSTAYARWALGLARNTNKQHGILCQSEEPQCSVPTMSLFHRMCSGLYLKIDKVQRQRMFQETESYMASTMIEQSNRQSQQVPTPEQYFDMRLVTSGIYPALALFDYIAGVRLPESIMESNSMKSLWRETTILCMLVNDIYSFKKELASGSVLNMIPVLFNARVTDDLNETMGVLVNIMHNSSIAFGKAAEELAELASVARLEAEVETYIDVCRTVVTGLNKWALTTKRYSMEKYQRKDGSIIIAL